MVRWIGMIAGLIALPMAGQVAAAEFCGAPVQGQYAEEFHCATAVLMPDGSAGPAALLDAMPDTYPWLFRLSPGGEAPAFTITVNSADASFTVLPVHQWLGSL